MPSSLKELLEIILDKHNEATAATLTVCSMFLSTCVEMRPQRCSSLPEDRAMVVARWQEGGWSSDCCRCRWAGTGPEECLSAASQTHHWNVKGLSGVLAAWRRNRITVSHKKTLLCCFNMNITQQRSEGKQPVIDSIQKKQKEDDWRILTVRDAIPFW